MIGPQPRRGGLREGLLPAGRDLGGATYPQRAESVRSLAAAPSPRWRAELQTGESSGLHCPRRLKLDFALIARLSSHAAPGVVCEHLSRSLHEIQFRDRN
jgi:hypothetical protein